MHAPASVERRSRETRETRAAAREEKRETLSSCLSRLAPSVTRVVIYVSRAFCSTDQEKKERLLVVQCETDHYPTLKSLVTDTHLIQTPLRIGQFSLSPQMKLRHFLWIDQLKRKLWDVFFFFWLFILTKSLWSLVLENASFTVPSFYLQNVFLLAQKLPQRTTSVLWL